MEIRYSFVKQGSVIEKDEHSPLYPKKNRLIIDVGNRLAAGVIDTHHLPGGAAVKNRRLKCSAAVIAAQPYLVLDNLTSDAPLVEIVLHSFPDLDCLVSAYFARSLIYSGCLPEHARLWADYTEQVDRGLLLINQANLLGPAALVCAIDEVLDRERVSLAEATLERGLELIEYVNSRLDQMSPAERSLHHPALLGNKHPFTAEADKLAADYKIYRREVEDEDCCTIVKAYVPVAGTAEPALTEVNALFWHKPPDCVLHKHWARGDEEHSPDGKGFVMTFIPQNVAPVDLKSLSVELPGLVNEIQPSRVIISVNPALPVSLKGLAVLLEEAECDKEQEILVTDNNIAKWRSRSKKRWQDAWCTNVDPWFDGRDAFYTIIDSPRIGSLLSIVEIKNITLNFFKPRITSHRCHLVLPFTYPHEKYADMLAWNKKYLPNTTDSFDWEKDTFTPYIQDYLFPDRQEAREAHRIFLPLKTEPLRDYLREKLCSTEFTLRKANGIIFRYGNGFIVIELELKLKTDELLEAGLDFNYRLVGLGKSILKEHIVNQKEFFRHGDDRPCIEAEQIRPWEKGLIYATVSISKNTLYPPNSEEILIKLAGALPWDAPYPQARHAEELSPKNIFVPETDVFYNFSKTGGALLILEDPLTDNNERHGRTEHRRQIIGSFFKVDFWSFTLALHQRHTLLHLSHQLAACVNNKDYARISKLRQIFLDFTTLGWFSQVSCNEVSMEIYKHWQKVLENQLLYDEVFQELEAVDNFMAMSRTRKIEWIGMFTLPVVLIGTFFGANFAEFRNIYMFSCLGGVIFGVVLIIWVLAMLYYFKRK